MLFDFQELIQIEKMLIAYVYVHIQVISIHGTQYKYRGYIVNFFCDIGTIYSQLLYLSKKLDMIILHLRNASTYNRLRRQFHRNFYIQREMIYI